MSVASLIVVVYNQTVDDVPVIKAALNAFVRPEIIVCDNSTHEYGNRAICETLWMALTFLHLTGMLIFRLL